uniref:NADH-ubiquinone oxidoreductase chain 2 n=1 Tax=Pselaphinae sp. 10 EF-2015 TaxID=1756854 RepID=A0A0S2M8T1_9COLE|nr:NADH deshydrogenase subunit 2 [Pselaphinae sp. 10 EF-2015]
MFLMTLILSTLISISANSWLAMWLGLEINLLSIIPLLNTPNNSYSSESSIKYFIIQAIASSVILMTLILIMKSFFQEYLMNHLILIFNSSLMMKMGTAPFHFWFPEIIEGLNWMMCFIMMSWQKVAPMIILNYMMNMNFLSFIIIINIMISSILGMNQTSLRKIMTYSSISHLSWMLASLMVWEKLWLFYFSIYTIIIFNLMYILNKFNIFYFNQLNSFMNKNLKFYLMFIINFFSLGGLPPFMGFFPKWLIIQVLVSNNFFIQSYILIMFSLITLYFYIRLMISSLMFLSIESNSHLKFKSNYLFMVMNLINISSLVFLTLIFNYF